MDGSRHLVWLIGHLAWGLGWVGLAGLGGAVVGIMLRTTVGAYREQRARTSKPSPS